MLLHIGAFHLDLDSHRKTPWQAIAPSTRLLSILLFVFASTLTPNGHWQTWGIYALGLLSLILLSRVTLSTLLKRAAVEFAFVGVVLLGTLFREGGEILWAWGIFKITTEGLTVLGSVTLKVLLSLLALNLLTLTTPVSALLNALVALRVPPLMVAILASMYRYIGVLVREFKALRRAAASRNLAGSAHWQRLILGNMMGTLFVRTYERGERVTQAMLARGYQGVPVVESLPPLRRRDRLALTLTLLWLLLGQVVYL
jgi:cobalt/nickel transport system permease protein